MMVGGVAYLFPINLNEKNKVRFEYLGLGLIFFTYAFISKHSMWPGYLALVPVLGVYLVIQSQRNNSFILNNLVFQKIGSWSYSIYLWHWPIVVLIYYSSASEVWIYLGIVLSITLGFLSYTYIENIKFKSIFSSINDFLNLKPLLMVFFVSAFGSMIYLSEGVNRQFRDIANSPKSQFIESYQTLHKNLDEAYWLKCDAYNSLSKFNILNIDKSCTDNNSEYGGIFLWGDSHAEGLSFGIRNGVQGIPFYQVTSSSCKASLYETSDQSGKIKTACDHSNNFALEQIKKIKPDFLFIAQANSHEKTNWLEISERLKLYGVGQVILIGPVPQWNPSLPRVVVKDKNWGMKNSYINDVGLDDIIFHTDSLLKKVTFPENMTYFSLIENMCINKSGLPFCIYRLGDGALMQVDYGHLSPKGSQYIFDHIIKPHFDLTKKNFKQTYKENFE